MQSTQHPATLPGDNASGSAATLRHAAAYLRRYGWTQYCYYRYTLDTAATGTFPQACVAGAIRCAVLGRPIENLLDVIGTFWNDEEQEAIWAAEDLLADLINPDRTPGAFEPGELIHDWNDAPGRTLADVLDTLETAHDTQLVGAR